jgi:hypothetical protein
LRNEDGEMNESKFVMTSEEKWKKIVGSEYNVVLQTIQPNKHFNRYLFLKGESIGDVKNRFSSDKEVLERF